MDFPGHICSLIYRIVNSKGMSRQHGEGSGLRREENDDLNLGIQLTSGFCSASVGGPGPKDMLLTTLM